VGRRARLKRERRCGLSEQGREIRRRLAALDLTPTLVETPTQERKVSDALLELVDPIVQALAQSERTQACLEQLVELGTLAWNAYLLPGGDDAIAHALTALTIDHEDLEVARRVLAVFVERRRTLFADDRRLILSTVVTLSASGELKVTAAHAPVPATLTRRTAS